jgi:hypothetical protein
VLAPALIASLALVMCCYGCLDECAREACDAAAVPHARGELEQGVVGVIATRSDACRNDCCPCSWSQAELTVWHSDQPLDEGQGLRLVASGMPAATIDARRAYSFALEPGEHMLCLSSTCAGLHIEPGVVFTVNVQQRYGPSSLLVFGPGDREPRDDLVFSVNKE